MQLSSSESFEQTSDDKEFSGTRSRKKHKRLDAICEKAYTRSHSRVAFEVGLKKAEVLEDNGEENDTEVRRSSRVRRAPVLLDASPAPPRKRRRVDNKDAFSSMDKGKRVVRVKAESQFPSKGNVDADFTGWRTRLRSRGSCVGFNRRENGGSSVNSRTKLFRNSKGVKEEWGFESEETEDGIEELAQGDLTVGKSKRCKALLENEDKDNDSDGNTEDDKEVLEEISISRSEENLLVSETKDGLFNGIGSKDVLEPSSSSEHCHQNDIPEFVEDNCQLEKCNPGKNQTNDNLDGKENLNVVSGSLTEDIYRAEAETENVDDMLKKHSPQTGKDQINAVDLDISVEDVSLAKNGVKPIEDGIPESFEKITVGLDAKVRSGHMKEGRHCGLCGGGSNGKPPKKLIQDVNGCDKEESSGGSTSEEPGYDVWDGFGDEPGWLGRLLGPINDRYGIAGIWVHQQCAVWSPEVYFSGLGCLKNVRAALWRGRVLKCSRCGKPGATIGCRVDRCPRTYHLPCARATGSLFDHRKFLIACNDHRHHFQPHGIHYLRRLKKLKERKVKFDLRKTSNEALRKDIEAEEKLLENCGEDEEFVKRESKRLQRDLLRIAPTYIGGGNCDSGAQHQGWESIAGLHDVIQCMKEVVFLPLLYPEFFSNLGITPPRGVLLHGYPGTGKTLVVRALIGSCARGDKRIAYFARKGADCLGKYVGDAERQLRLLFQVAEKSQPSIIFFDEIDGLAPCRTRHQDQTHSSVVSTLLALMDGLKSRGSVVVIGATNRPDAVDPALRRPGRFDREIYFPLPSANDREAILSLHTKKWPKPISGSLLRLVARKTVGFAGADLQALCTQAAMIALRRSFPLKELLSSAGERVLSSKPPLLTSFTVEEKDWLDALSHSPPPCSRRDVGIAVNDVVSSPLASHLVPFMLRPLSELLVSLYLDERVWLPTSLSKSAIVIRNAIVSALSRKGDKYDSWWLNLHDLLQKPETLHDIEDNLRHETILTEDGVCNSDSVLDVGDDAYLKCKPSKLQRIGAYHVLPNESGRKSGFRILIAGKPSSGQRHLASCLLHCFSGNVEMRKLDLATMSQEGQGDAVQGLTQILTRCSSLSPCVVFLPRIDLWAVETCYQTNEGQDGSPSNGKKSGELEGSSEMQNAFTISSYLWSSFMEQVESIGISTSVMILATSEMLFEDLPTRISQFFRCETSKSGISTSLKAAVPRFVVHLDGNMCNDMVLDISATKVSNNLAQYYIELINKGAHESSSPVEDISDAAAVIKNIDAVPRSSNSVSDVKTVVDTSSAALRHSVKGKSNLMLAISTFGYQILCYPHFAELCWVTSKLKEGPCTDINGPWKRWPFNSCIARPVNSADERISGACSSKDKEKSYVVRGLVAIGFLAYKGEYTSLREVSLQVRKVLELLVARINSKIQAGKNKLNFFHVLSHVASFDDLVTSWSYALRSLEVDDPLLDENPRLPCRRSPSSHVVGGIHEDNQCKENISHETEALKDDPQGIQSNEIGTRALIVDLDLNVPIKDIEGESAVDISSNPNVTNHVASDVHVNSHLHKGSGRAETCAPLATENPSEDSGVLLEGSPFSTGHKIDSVIRGQHNEGSRFPSTANETSACPPEKCSDGIAKTSACPPEDRGLVSVYHCCSQCLVNLRKVILTLVKTEITEDNVTIEGFHDVVAASSAKLQSEVPKLVERSEHPLAASALLDRLQKPDAEPSLRIPVFGALSQLECSSEVWERILFQSFGLLADSNDEPLAATVDFVFKAALHCQHLPEAVRSVRVRLKNLGAEVSPRVLDYLSLTVNNFADIAEAFIRDIDCDDDFGSSCSAVPCEVFVFGDSGTSEKLSANEQAFRASYFSSDIYMLIEMLSIPCLAVEASQAFERAVARGAIVVQSMIMVLERRLARGLHSASKFVADNFQQTELRVQQDDFSTVVGLAETLSLSKDLRVRGFVKLLYAVLFKLYTDESYRLRMLKSLVDRATNTSESIREVDFDLEILVILVYSEQGFVKPVLSMMREVAELANADKAALWHQLCTRENEIVHLREEKETELASMAKEKASISKKLSDSEAANNRLKSDMKAEMDRTARERKELSEQIQESESQLEWLRSEKDEEIAKLVAEKKVLQDHLVDAETQLSQLNSRKRDELKRVTKEKNALVERVKKAEAARIKFDEELKRHAAENVTREETCRNLEDEVRRLKQTVGQTEEEKREKEEQVTRCEVYIDGMEAKLQTCQQYIQHLEASLQEEMSRHAPLYGVGLEALSLKELETISRIHEEGLRQIHAIQQRKLGPAGNHHLVALPRAHGLYSPTPPIPPPLVPNSVGIHGIGHMNGNAVGPWFNNH